MNAEVERDPLTHKIIGAAIEVHRALGPGLLEELYEDACCVELEEQKLHYERQRQIGVVYKGRNIGDMYADIVVENTVILELKSVNRLNQIHMAQLMTYMKLMNLKKGCLSTLMCDIRGMESSESSFSFYTLCSLCLCGESHGEGLNDV